MTLRELLEQRARFILEMRSYHQHAPPATAATYPPNRLPKFDAAKSKLETIEKRIERQKLLDDAETAHEGTADAHVRRRVSSTTNCGILACVRAIAAQCSRHRRTRRCAARRAQISAELSGVAVCNSRASRYPCRFSKARDDNRQSCDRCEPDFDSTYSCGPIHRPLCVIALVVRRLGARVLSGLVGNVDVPKHR